jgi:thioesterase domain-containing protein
VSTETIPGRLVTIVRRKDRPTCLMLPGAGGGLNPYLRLASFLGQTYNVYAVRPAGLLPAEVPEESIPEMTRSALDALDGAGLVPELVFGWSLGGVVAWEVCASLAERGHQPDLVVVDSSPLPRVSTVEDDGLIRETIVEQLGPRPNPETVDRLVRTFEAHVGALADYRTHRTYDGQVLLMMCAPNDTDIPVDAVRRWHELAGRLEIGRLRAGHFDVFEPEHLPELTDAIGGFLARTKEVKS